MNELKHLRSRILAGMDVQQELGELRGEIEQLTDAYERRLAALGEALVGTRERIFVDGHPCWCPRTVYEDYKLYAEPEWEFKHSEWCAAARAALSVPQAGEGE